MRTSFLFVIALGALVGCGGGRGPAPTTLGVDENLDEARRHEEEAKVHDELASEARARARSDSYACGDRVLADQVTSGGERLIGRTPCWSAEADAVSRHRADAARLRADAAEHRRRARELLAAEDVACAGIPVEEVEHSLFAHFEDVAAVSAELDGDRLRGARVRFRPIPDLTGDWMRRSIACHQARAAAVGFDPTHLSYDPTLVAGAEAEVIDEAAGPVVVIRGRDDAAALVIYARAEALLDPLAADEP
jgi:hypothetical protein